MDAKTRLPTDVMDYEVVDAQGNSIGSIESMWVDTATNQPEFVAVKTGWLMGKTHIIPVAGADLDPSQRRMRVPYPQDRIKEAPHFDQGAELSDEDEQRVYRHYGLDRSTAPSPTGLADAGERQTEGRQEMTKGGERAIPLAKEELEVGKRPVEAGRVRLRKVVRTEHVQEPVNLQREQVTVERVPAQGEQVPQGAFREQEIEVPVNREEPVVEKEAHVTGQVRVGKTAEAERRTVEGDIRREDVDVERRGDVELRRTGQERR